jgi:UDP-galactopyranose mutase
LAFAAADIIERDVAIIGGGSSGTHAAITLEDNGYATIIVEEKERIGGHTEMYFDPNTGHHIDYGVVIFHDDDYVENYFSRFHSSRRHPELASALVSDHSMVSSKLT